MNTTRSGNDPIITSDDSSNTKTERLGSEIISSGVEQPGIISSSVSSTIQLNNISYNIIQQIARSGESEVFLVDCVGQKLVFKLYYHQYKPKDEVLIQLKGLSHPDIIAVYDFGYHNGRFYEIAEYAEGGTLNDLMPLKNITRIRELVNEITNAFEYCHSHGIIHRDIKPENIFFRDSKKIDLAISDFGIASALDEGFSKRMTGQARTTIFAAPEVFQNIGGKTVLGKEVDYYALGMTLLNLWTGKDPFSDVGEFGVMRIKIEGRIVLPDDMPDELKTLIKGLLTVEVSNRWGYSEIQRWLRGEPVQVYFTTHVFEYKNYPFGYIDGENIVVNNPKDLATYLEKYPSQGEGHLYRHTIAKWIESVNPGLYNELMDIVERDFPHDRKAGLTKAIYILDRGRAFCGFDGTILKTQEEIAKFFGDHFDHYEKDLQNPNASFYLFLDARNYKQQADEYRNYFRDTVAEAALNVLILKLQGADKFIIGNYTIYQPNELIQVDADMKARIINQLANPNSKLSLWISSFVDLRPTIDKWRLLKRYEPKTLRYALTQGFEIHGKVVLGMQQFTEQFRDNLNLFFLEREGADNRREVDYWLRNYMNCSLTLVTADVLLDLPISDDNYESMLAFVFAGSVASGKSYDFIESFLERKSQQILNDQKLLDRLVEISKISIKEYWKNSFKCDKSYLKIISSFLDHVEKNLAMCHQYYSALLTAIDNDITLLLRNDLDTNKNNHQSLKVYTAELQKVLDRIGKIEPNLEFVKRKHNEESLLVIRRRWLSSSIKDEKIASCKKLSVEYDKTINERKAEANKLVVKWKPTNFAVVFGFILGLITCIFFTIGWAIEGKYFIGWSIIGGILIGVLADLIGLALGYLIYAVFYPFHVMKQRKKAVDAIRMTEEERATYRQSEKAIEDHFTKKLDFELMEQIGVINSMSDNELREALPTTLYRN